MESFSFIIRLATTFIACFISCVAFAQYDFTRNDNIIVHYPDGPLPNPWAGGLNSAQFSEGDLDGDGDLDLFIFDRMGNRPLIFLNESTQSGEINYKHTYDWNDQIPALKNWALMRDFNCDGKPDLISNSSNGMKIHQNIGVDSPEFELDTDPLIASYNLSGTPFDAGVFCVSVDVPSIQDHDGDGDLDIFSWTEISSTIYFYKNMSMENDGSCGLDFIAANRCYGKLSEASESATVFIGDEALCDFNVINPEIIGEDWGDGHHPHTGGTIYQVDLDQNGIKDLVISDVTDIIMNTLMMSECPDGQDSATTFVPQFPADFTSTNPIELRTFPAAFCIDVNNDGVQDLIASPNTTVDTEDNESCWLYINNGENDLPEYEFSQPDFLQDGMIDFGRNAYPVPVDYNSDGLMDLAVSNNEYNEAVDSHPSQIALFENTGTALIPEFTLIDANWLNIPQYDIEAVYPTFGDLDNDGDIDMILGEQSGNMHYFQNQAGPDATMDLILMVAAMTDVDGGSLDVGQFSTPQLFDIDDNGTLDLLVGEKNGNINYLENTGTPEDYAFLHQIDTVGQAVASNFLGINGYSVPWFWRDQNNSINLMVGTEVGILNHYDNIEGNLDGEFNQVEEAFDDIWEGTRSAGSLYDWDGDNKLDLMYGQIGGGIAFYIGGDIIEDIAVQPGASNFSIFPNPTNSEVTIRLNEEPSSADYLMVFNSLGQMIYQEQMTSRSTIIDLTNYSAGVYVLSLSGSKGKTSQRLLKF